MKINDWFIDADTHITEPGDVWTARLPEKYRDAAPHIVRTDDGVDVWRFGTRERQIPVGATAVAGWHEPFPSIPKNLDECPPAAYDAKARLEYMDEIGAWAMALYPNIGGFGSETFLGLGDPELMLACVRAYNDWLIEWISPDPRRFIPVMATPFWDVEATVSEIHRCREIGHKAILFTSAPQDFGMPFIGDAHWNPIWQAAQDLDLPISLHIGSGDFQDQLLAPERFRAHGIGPSTVSGSMSILLANAIQLMDVVMSGVLPRNPGLRLVSVESGIGWLPFIGDAHWNPIWQAAQDLDLPISLHIGSGDFQDQLMAPERFRAHGIGPSTVSGSMSILLANAIQLMDVVMSGVLPRNPGLRLASVESGIGWLPFVKEALDHGFEYANVRKEKPEFTRLPSDYIREQIWACTFFEEFAARNFLDEIGSDRVMFETDYPHPICLHGADVRKKIDAAFGGLPDVDRKRILFDNAAELYDVEAPDRPWAGS